ncbi:MAG: hypothetical protein DRI90_14905 [Deltaproteobacteria bacterium]|nr:MAG: hypothetical protein DRI90_14905 [Deltaproteobacteria bacterium]
MDTAFSHALRIVVCQSCGGAVHGAAEGGKATCSVCEEAVELPPRDEAEHGAGLPVIDEAQRLARLREQDPSAPALAPAIEPLVHGGELIADRAADAFTEWQLSRAALAGGAAVAEDRFYGTTLLLARHMARQGDDLMLRAVLETALDVLPSPSRKQVIRGMTAREAARLGDLPASEDWFAPCDPRSYDLHADSAYRCTAAYLATVKRKFEGVLTVLGPQAGALPMCDNLDPLCAVLRANAHERLGDLGKATAELSSAMERMPDGPELIEQIVRSHADLAACRRCYVSARSKIDGSTVIKKAGKGAAAARAGSPPPPASTRRRALPWMILSVAFLVLYLVTEPASTTSSGQRIDVFFFVLAVSFALPVCFLLWKQRRGRKR